MQLHPGGDHPEMPADALINIERLWEPPRSQVLCGGAVVICKPLEGASVAGVAMPFCMGSWLELSERMASRGSDE